MPQVTLGGHPLHPQMIVMPAGLLPFSLLLDLLYAVTRRQSFADASYYTMMGGFVGGLAAGAAGAADYGTIPEDHPAKKVGNGARRDERRSADADGHEPVDAAPSPRTGTFADPPVRRRECRPVRLRLVRRSSRLPSWHAGARGCAVRYFGGAPIAGG